MVALPFAVNYQLPSYCVLPCSHYLTSMKPVAIALTIITLLTVGVVGIFAVSRNAPVPLSTASPSLALPINKTDTDTIAIPVAASVADYLIYSDSLQNNFQDWSQITRWTIPTLFMMGVPLFGWTMRAIMMVSGLSIGMGVPRRLASPRSVLRFMAVPQGGKLFV